MEKKPLQLPALGRPFTLGTLYNANTNQIVPAISLCDHEPADVKVCSNITYQTDMTSNDSMESKMKSLGIRGSLTISALALPMEFKGSGSYLSDKKTSKRQARVVLQSSGTTRHESLSSRCFSKEKVENHLEMINVFGVTHIAVGITYGHQFFLQLETICASEEETQKVEGAIKLKLSSWVPFEAEGKLKTTYESKYKKELNELQVKIHGTVELENNPISFQEALDIIKRIPDQMKDKDSPMTVYLLPLAAIHSSVPKVCSEIEEDMLSDIISVFEDINSSEVALSGIQISDIAQKEQRIQQNAKQLLTMLHKYKIRLQMNLHDKLGDDPNMEKSKQILEVLRKHNDSPYSAYILGRYVSNMEKEVKYMEDLVRALVGDARKQKVTMDIRSDEIYDVIPLVSSRSLVLELPIIAEKNNLHEAMKCYLENDERYTQFMEEPFTLPFEDKQMQLDIGNLANKFVDIATGKPQTIRSSSPVVVTVNTLTCLFKGYSDNKCKPSLTMYDGLRMIWSIN